jgi:hypothetical protein
VACVYNLRDVAFFVEEGNLVHDEHFGNEHFISKLAYLCDIFEKFSALNASMHGKDTNDIAVTEKVKAFIGKLGSWNRKLQGKSLDIFSRSKDFVEEKSVGTSDTGIDQCIKDHSVNLHSRFSKYFPEEISDKYKWITNPFHAVSPQNYDFSLEEDESYIDIHLTFL